MLGATPNYRNAQLLRGQPFCPSDKMCPPRSIYHPQLNFNIELTVMVGLSNSLLLSPTAGIFDQFFPIDVWQPTASVIVSAVPPRRKAT